MKSLVGGVASADASVREEWGRSFIQTSSRGAAALSTTAEQLHARSLAWGGGEFQAARAAMRDACKQRSGFASLPVVKIPPKCATGPSGERQEHIDDIVKFAGISVRKRLFCALDKLTIQWSRGGLPDTCRWLLNTQALFLIKQCEPECKQFDDIEWLRESESNNEISDDSNILEEAVSDSIPPVGMDTESPIKVRPIQMGEFVRKSVSRRLLAINSSDAARTLTAMRQLGVGVAGGAEALAIFHQLLYESWKAGLLPVAVARIKVDEENCFGSLEWDSIRKALHEFHPKHASPAAWKHSSVSHIEQSGVPPQLKDRGAEQGDADGPKECALTLRGVARNARESIHAKQRRGELRWACAAENAVEVAAA